ncbi:NAC domain-containing protein [Dipodascopsis tothii]|uniref:NAC domain-containing protein n=1 Tax=Dipodascopsis tothii TaxID=44089 RepID=UPI0034CFCEE3
MSIEEIEEHSHTHEHGHEHSHDHAEEEGIPAGADVQVYSRSERKARLSLIQKGMKKVTGINRVTMRRSRNILFVIANPEVYKSSDNVYIVFGEAKIEDMSAAQQAALQQLASEEGAAAAAAPVETPAVADKGKGKEIEAPVELDGEVDATGLDEKDIEIVISQADCSRAAAVAALRKNNSDVISSIMDLSS